MPSESSNFSYIIHPVRVETQYVAWRIGDNLITRIAFDLDKGYEDDWDDGWAIFPHYKNIEPILNSDGSRTRYEVRAVIPTDIEIPDPYNIGVQLVKYRIGRDGDVSRAYRDAVKESLDAAPRRLRNRDIDISCQRLTLVPIDGIDIHHTLLRTYSYGIKSRGATNGELDTDKLFHFLSAVTEKNCMCDIIKCFHDFDNMGDDIDMPACGDVPAKSVGVSASTSDSSKRIERTDQHDDIVASTPSCDGHPDNDDTSLSDVITVLERIADEQSRQTALLRDILEKLRHQEQCARVDEKMR